ncbi:hypothetical protein SCANM63S_00327 [Streptomyces canarius]
MPYTLLRGFPAGCRKHQGNSWSGTRPGSRMARSGHPSRSPPRRDRPTPRRTHAPLRRSDDGLPQLSGIPAIPVTSSTSQFPGRPAWSGGPALPSPLLQPQGLSARAVAERRGRRHRPPGRRTGRPGADPAVRGGRRAAGGGHRCRAHRAGRAQPAGDHRPQLQAGPGPGGGPVRTSSASSASGCWPVSSSPSGSGVRAPGRRGAGGTPRRSGCGGRCWRASSRAPTSRTTCSPPRWPRCCGWAASRRRARTTCGASGWCGPWRACGARTPIMWSSAH